MASRIAPCGRGNTNLPLDEKGHTVTNFRPSTATFSTARFFIELDRHLSVMDKAVEDWAVHDFSVEDFDAQDFDSQDHGVQDFDVQDFDVPDNLLPAHEPIVQGGFPTANPVPASANQFATMDFDDIIDSKDRRPGIHRRTPFDSDDEDDEVTNVLTPAEEEDL